MKRLLSPLVVIAVVIAFITALLAGPLSSVAWADPTGSTACLREDAPGCTHGLPTDQYNALLALMQANPSPDVTVAPYDKNEIWSYSGFWRLADGSQLFDSPGGNVINVAPVGFNFVSIRSIQGDYAQIGVKNKQWVLRKDLKQSYASTYTGVLFDKPLPFPMAWVIQASIPASVPGGTRLASTPAIDRYTRVYIYASIKVQDWEWYLVGPGQWLPQQKVARVIPATRPDGLGDNDKWASVNLYEKVMTVYQGNNMVFATLVSPGLPGWSTEPGVFKVWKKLATSPMSGAMGQPDFYALPAVPYVMYFDKDISLHGTYWHDGFGFNHSHGCVNLSIGDAHWLYDWSGQDDLTVQVTNTPTT